MTFNTDDDFHAPTELRTDEFLLRPLREADAQLDYDAVMESVAFLRLWEQTGWPRDGFTVEENRDDVIGMQQRHDAGESFTYTVLDPTERECLGCVYVFPPDARFLANAQITALTDATWSDYEALVYFWVRQSRLTDGLDQRLLTALGGWMQQAWRLERHLIIASEPFAQQLAMLDASGLQRLFRFTLPENEDVYLAYAAG